MPVPNNRVADAEIHADDGDGCKDETGEDRVVEGLCKDLSKLFHIHEEAHRLISHDAKYYDANCREYRNPHQPANACAGRLVLIVRVPQARRLSIKTL